MLPNILGSTASHYKRQRVRNLSGNNSVGILHQGPQHPQVFDQYFHGRQEFQSRRDTSEGELYPYYHDTPPPQLPLRPRSADPSPQRTACRIESLREMHGGPLFMNEPRLPMSGFSTSHRHLLGGSTSNLPLAEGFSHLHQRNHPLHLSQTPFPVGNPHSLVPVGTPSHIKQPTHSSPHPHHHHEVLYVCHGQCTGPRCDFSKSTRQMQSLVYLDPAQQAIEGRSEPVHFRSEVVETAPSAFRKLDKKRATISQMRELLATKLENKHRMRMSRRQRNLGRDKSREHQGYNQRKSLSSNTIERDVNVAESFYRRCGSRSQGSDVNEDLSLRGSKIEKSRKLSSHLHMLWFNI